MGALKKSAAELQKNINNLQQDIESIARIEKQTEKSLKAALIDMKTHVKTAAEGVQKDILGNLQAYLKEGKEIEKSNVARKKRELEEERKREEQTPFFLVKTILKGKAGIEGRLSKEDVSEKNQTIANAKNGIVTFDKQSEANDFRGEIEKSIRTTMLKAEKEFQICIEKGIGEFSKDLDRQRLESLEKIQKSVQTNIDGFDIQIRLPNSKTISLDTSVSKILKSAVEAKTKTVTRQRRQSGSWGTVCSWFGTDDWGWESYSDTEDYYEVDLGKINNSSLVGVNTLFKGAHSALDEEIYPQLQQGVDEFFGAFRAKIENVRGDLMSGIQKHSLDQAKKTAILKDSAEMVREASGIEIDCTALNDSAETLRRKEGVSLARGEVLV